MKLSKESDDTLVTYTLNGTKDAFGELVCRYHKNLTDYIRAFGIPASDADDVAQEVWILALMKLSTYRFEGPFFAWIRSIARRCFCNMWNSYYFRDRRAVSRLCFDVVSPEPNTRVMRLDEQRDQLQHCFTKIQMSDFYHETFRRFYYQRQKQTQIADEMNVALGTVKRRLHTARCKIKQAS